MAKIAMEAPTIPSINQSIISIVYPQDGTSVVQPQ